MQLFDLLQCPTPGEWLDAAVQRRAELLNDHANCEKKAASTALSLLFAYAEDRVITERIFPDRYMHLAELLRLGARIRRQGSAAVVEGARTLSGASIMASDLRASAALVLAGLVAQGESEVHRVYHIDRGYERIEERLARLGARIQRAALPGKKADLPA